MSELAEVFRNQARICAEMASPIYAALLERSAADLVAGGPVASCRRLGGPPDPGQPPAALDGRAPRVGARGLGPGDGPPLPFDRRPLRGGKEPGAQRWRSRASAPTRCGPSCASASRRTRCVAAAPSIPARSPSRPCTVSPCAFGRSFQRRTEPLHGPLRLPAGRARDGCAGRLTRARLRVARTTRPRRNPRRREPAGLRSRSRRRLRPGAPATPCSPSCGRISKSDANASRRRSRSPPRPAAARSRRRRRLAGQQVAKPTAGQATWSSTA